MADPTNTPTTDPTILPTTDPTNSPITDPTSDDFQDQYNDIMYIVTDAAQYKPEFDAEISAIKQTQLVCTNKISEIQQEQTTCINYLNNLETEIARVEKNTIREYDNIKCEIVSEIKNNIAKIALQSIMIIGIGCGIGCSIYWFVKNKSNLVTRSI